jgi:hypothetical protein
MGIWTLATEAARTGMFERLARYLAAQERQKRAAAFKSGSPGRRAPGMI